MLKTLKPFLAPIVLLTALLVAITLLALGWNHRRKAYENALREAEAAKLAMRGQIVSQEETVKGLQVDKDKLLAENDLLRESYETAMRAAPDAKPVAVADLRTESMPVYKAPRVARGVRAPETPALLAPPPAPGSSLSCPAPLDPVLLDGDKVSVEVKQIILKTGEANTLITGIAEVYRDTPDPRMRIYAGKFQSRLSEVQGLAPPAPPRWGALALGACGAQGCGPGAGVLFPPVAVLGLRLEALAGLVLTPGAALALGGAGVRW